MEDRKYWVYTHTTPDGMVYVGMSRVKYTSQRWNPRLYKNISLEHYIKLWGWENIKHRVIKTGLTEKEARFLEEEMRDFCKTNGVSINIRKSGNQYDVGKKEYKRNWQIENREYSTEWHRKWRENNRERYNAYHREWSKRKKEVV